MKFMNAVKRFYMAPDNGGSAGGGSGDGNSTGQEPEGRQSGQAPQIDYEKIASLVAGKQAVTEDSVLKGYFKQQGLSKEEMEQAISAFKKQKAENTPDTGALQAQAIQAQQMAVRAQIENKALLMSGEIGVDMKTMPYLIKMADLSDVAPEGNINDEKLKEALNNVLQDVPQLKSSAGGDRDGGFRLGADTGSTDGGTDDDALMKAFGLKK